MIAYKGRENKRGKAIKMPRSIERLYKEGKCRDCSVVVTRMDFAKILGKFTKVKIQYESSSSPKNQKTSETTVPNSNARLKNNENGMVLLRRSAYNQHPVKDLVNSHSKKLKNSDVTPVLPRQVNNVLKENNGPNKTEIVKKKNLNSKERQINVNQNCNKQYAIIFNNPSSNNNNDYKCDFSLMELLPKIDKSIFPSKEWCIDYFPKNEEPTDDKVYDRIAAELEDLMYNEKPDVKCNKPEPTENKVDDFPSIMDILNDNNTPVNNTETKDQSSSIEFKDNLESSDVEAMLLGSQPASNDKEQTNNKSSTVEVGIEPTPMEVDSTDVNKLIEDVVQFSSNAEVVKADSNEISEIENPHSPSILDEALQKGIEEHLPCEPPQKMESDIPDNSDTTNSNQADTSKEEAISEKKEALSENVIVNDQSPSETTVKQSTENILNIPPTTKIEDITHVIFKKVVDGVCQKSVTCPKNLKYNIELEGKSVEFLGAPKYISSLEDLQVLLQIVNETDLRSLYVLY